jgi:hypothetical protein
MSLWDAKHWNRDIAAHASLDISWVNLEGDKY